MAFTFKLEHADGRPADPATFRTAVPTWRPGDTIPLGRDKALRVIEIRPEASHGAALKRLPQRRTLDRGLANCG